MSFMDSVPLRTAVLGGGVDYGDFSDAAVHWDFTTDSLTDLNSGLALTYTRADAVQNYFDSSSILQTATTDEPPFHHDPATGKSLGLLVEREQEHSMLHSRDFSDGVWQTLGTVPGKTQDITDVFGVANSAWTLEDDNAAAFEGMRQSVTIANDGATHCAWVRIKIDADQTRFPEFSLRYLGGVEQRLAQHLNTQTGATTDRVSVGTVDSGVITENGYRKWWLAVTNNTSGNTSCQIDFYPAITTIAGTTETAALGTVGIDTIQRELNASYPSTDIPTVGAAATREAPSASVTVTTLLGAANTLFVAARTGIGAGVVCQIDDGTENERYRVERNSGNEIHVIVTDGGVEQANLNLGVLADHTDFKVAARFAANDIAASLDGGVEETDASATLPTVTTFRVGMDTAGEEYDSTIDSSALWAVGKSNQVLRELGL